MATQHDYVISDADGATVLADWNSVLQAIVKLNEGATEPANTFPYMLWYDTTANILKQRNGANTAWLNRFFDSGATGQPGARKNAFINGDFLVAQRGTSFAAVADGAYTLDRWVYNKSGAMVHTITQSTDRPTVAQSKHDGTASIKLDCTTIDSSIAAGDYCTIGQKIEGYNYTPIANQTFTLSFWHKHTKTGTYCVSFRNSSKDRSYVAEYTQTTTNTWEYATVTVSALPSGGGWNRDTGVGLFVTWAAAVGSTYQTTAGAWQSGNFMGTSSQVNATDSASNDMLIAQAQIERGSGGTVFEHRDYNTEVGLCQRYFTKTYNINVAPGTVTDVGVLVGASASTNSAPGIVVWRFPVAMNSLAAPTITLYSPGTGSAGYCENLDTSSDATAAIYPTTAGIAGCNIQVSSAVTADQRYGFHATASAEI